MPSYQALKQPLYPKLSKAFRNPIVDLESRTRENSKPNRRQAINAFRYFLEKDLHFGGAKRRILVSITV